MLVQEKLQTDEALVGLIANHDHGAFTLLVKRHVDRYFGFAATLLQNYADAEDAVQAAFLKLWTSPQSFDSGNASFKTWFYRVVSNQCRDRQRWFKRQHIGVENYIRDVVERSGDQKSPEQELERQQNVLEWQIQLEMALSKLAFKEREVLSLSMKSNCTQREAAEILKLSQKAFESRLIRAKTKLSKLVSLEQVTQHRVEPRALSVSRANNRETSKQESSYERSN